jgi:hypothetical protein
MKAAGLGLPAWAAGLGRRLSYLSGVSLPRAPALRHAPERESSPQCF